MNWLFADVSAEDYAKLQIAYQSCVYIGALPYTLSEDYAVFMGKLTID